MYKFFILIFTLFCVCSYTEAQITDFLGNPNDSICENKKCEIVSKLNSIFKANNLLLGEDSIKQILSRTDYYMIPLFSIVDSNKANVGRPKWFKIKKQNCSNLFLDYDVDTMRLQPHTNRVAWIFMFYDKYLLGYYHFSSQNKLKNGDYYVLQTLKVPNLKRDIFELPLQDTLSVFLNSKSFAIYGYLSKKFYYQDTILFIHKNNRIIDSENILDLL